MQNSARRSAGAAASSARVRPPASKARKDDDPPSLPTPAHPATLAGPLPTNVGADRSDYTIPRSTLTTSCDHHRRRRTRGAWKWRRKRGGESELRCVQFVPQLACQLHVPGDRLALRGARRLLTRSIKTRVRRSQFLQSTLPVLRYVQHS